MYAMLCCEISETFRENLFRGGPGGRVSSSDNDYGNFDVYEYENDQKAYK